MNQSWNQRVNQLHGPILVLGASGFIGANLLRNLLEVRSDVYGTVSRFPAWRLEGLPEAHVLAVDLLADANVRQLFQNVRPKTVFNCVAYGAYSFEKDTDLVYRTNINSTAQIIEILCQQSHYACLIQAGSSSEYGEQANQPAEGVALTPNSHYSVSKTAVSGLIYYAGKTRRLPCANLRLYSVYGPFEDSSRLIPSLIFHGKQRQYSPLVNPEVSRDFVYIDDVCDAFVDTALQLKEPLYGESFNIGTGIKTKISTVAQLVKGVFEIPTEPVFSSMENRHWDVMDWVANPQKAKELLNWEAKTSLKEGFLKTIEWYEQLEDPEAYHKSSKKFEFDTKHSISAIIACYKDAQAIPFMYQRLVEVFTKLKVDYEIIFVNDNSPDDSQAVIQDLSRQNHRVVGITHSRNFGSQSAFRSGMEIATKNACVLMDGDLQDPPEMIEKFFDKWKEGYDVVYGIRTQREAPFYMQLAYKGFYRIFDKFSYVKMPRDAGDFSLIDKRVMRCLLLFPERDLFLRGIRAFVGFKQIGVEYRRPERMFGVSTNNLLKNLGWAKKAIFSFSNTPLNILSFIGWSLFVLSFVLIMIQTVSKLVFPQSAPAGITTLFLLITFFGSLNALGISLLGEYIAKILEEVKRRPHFIRRCIIKGGHIQPAAENIRKEA